MLALKRAVVVSTFRTVYSARLLLNATQGSFLRLSFCSSVFCSAVAPLLSPSKSCLVQAVPPPFQHFILVWFLTNYNKFHQVMQNATSNSQLIECGISRLIFTFFFKCYLYLQGPIAFSTKKLPCIYRQSAWDCSTHLQHRKHLFKKATSPDGNSS